MIILEDEGQKQGFHEIKRNCFREIGVDMFRVPLPVGDYILMNDKVHDVISRKNKRGVVLKKMDFLGTYKVSVDTKKDIQEVIGNICGKSHGRFRDECILAQNNGIELFILIENNDGIKSIEDLFHWQNPRLHRYNKIAYMHNIGKWNNVKLPKGKPTSGATLAKAMITMEKKYGVKFLFCSPYESAHKIIELLEGK